MDVTPYIAPPGRVVEKWFEWISAADTSYMGATIALIKTAEAKFPDANWIVAFTTQQTPELTIASGIAVFAK